MKFQKFKWFKLEFPNLILYFFDVNVIFASNWNFYQGLKTWITVTYIFLKPVWDYMQPGQLLIYKLPKGRMMSVLFLTGNPVSHT